MNVQKFDSRRADVEAHSPEYVEPDPSQPSPTDLVWVPSRRHGLDAHRPATDEFTACRRPMRTGAQMPAINALFGYDSKWCRRCWPVPSDEVPETALPAETPVALAPDHGLSGTWVTGSVDALRATVADLEKYVDRCDDLAQLAPAAHEHLVDVVDRLTAVLDRIPQQPGH